MEVLQDRVVLVTGGATKVGVGIVQCLARSGAHVIVVDIDAEGGAQLTEQIPQVEFHTLDITDDSAIGSLMDSISQRFGKLDGLVNLACSYLDEGANSPRADW
ncbi:SDR family NAD(P)-dependent oxidoreductase, partial [Glutamicibacter protophormiae]